MSEPIDTAAVQAEARTMFSHSDLLGLIRLLCYALDEARAARDVLIEGFAGSERMRLVAEAQITEAVTMLRTARHSLMSPTDVITALGACPHADTTDMTQFGDQRVRLLCTTCRAEIDGGPR